MREWDDLAGLENAVVDDGNSNLMLVDGTNLAFRYFGKAGNFAKDYIGTVSSLAKSYNAKRVICFFDVGASSFRKELYPSYKSHRAEERKEEDQVHFDNLFMYLRMMVEDDFPFEHYKFKNVEADDLIAYAIRHLKDKHDHTWLISSDKDFYQFLTDNLSIFNIFSRKEIDEDYLQEKWGLTPKEFLLYRILEGDTSDNISGVDGIGKVRGGKFAKEYQTTEALYKALPISGKAKYIQNLNAFKETIPLNEKLMNLLDYNDHIIDSAVGGEVREILSKYVGG